MIITIAEGLSPFSQRIDQYINEHRIIKFLKRCQSKIEKMLEKMPFLKKVLEFVLEYILLIVLFNVFIAILEKSINYLFEREVANLHSCPIFQLSDVKYNNTQSINQWIKDEIKNTTNNVKDAFNHFPLPVRIRKEIKKKEDTTEKFRFIIPDILLEENLYLHSNSIVHEIIVFFNFLFAIIYLSFLLEGSSIRYPFIGERRRICFSFHELRKNEPIKEAIESIENENSVRRKLIFFLSLIKETANFIYSTYFKIIGALLYFSGFLLLRIKKIRDKVSLIKKYFYEFEIACLIKIILFIYFLLGKEITEDIYLKLLSGVVTDGKPSVDFVLMEVRNKFINPFFNEEELKEFDMDEETKRYLDKYSNGSH